MGWLAGWGFRKELTIQHANVDGNLTDFPVYVKINADADFHESLATGFDIRFTQSDGTTLLKYERIYWTGGNGGAATADFFVKVTVFHEDDRRLPALFPTCHILKCLYERFRRFVNRIEAVILDQHKTWTRTYF